MGNVMTAARKISGKTEAKMFDDVSILQRKWQAALRPGDRLPRYEDVMLGSLGRLADHIVLMKENAGALEVSRTGRYAQKWLNDERWDVPLAALPPDCATALGEAASNALANGRPFLATAHCVRDGMVRLYDVLALPTSSRWGGTLVGCYVNEREGQYNLLDTIFSTTDEGVLSLAAISGAFRSTRSRSTAPSSRIWPSAPTASRSCAPFPASAAASTLQRPPKASRPSTSSTGCVPKAATRYRVFCSVRRGPRPKSNSCWASSASANRRQREIRSKTG
jgi:hypothetical protein